MRRVELAHLVFAHAVREREHGERVADGAEALDRRAPTRCVGESGALSSGCAVSRSWSSPEERVVLGVGDLGRVVRVVEPVVLADLVRERRDVLAGLFAGDPAFLGGRSVCGQG